MRPKPPFFLNKWALCTPSIKKKKIPQIRFVQKQFKAVRRFRRRDHLRLVDALLLSSDPADPPSFLKMPRKARRDCRKAESKKNHMNIRVEKLQQSIRKEKKEAAKNGKPAASSSAAPASSLTPSAAAFLSQMRADVADELPKLGSKSADKSGKAGDKSTASGGST